VAGEKTLETAEAGIVVTYDMTDSFDLVGEYLVREVSSSDTRIAYDRGIFLLAVRWSP